MGYLGDRAQLVPLSADYEAQKERWSSDEQTSGDSLERQQEHKPVSKRLLST
jgi:hypothetical protein